MSEKVFEIVIVPKKAYKITLSHKNRYAAMSQAYKLMMDDFKTQKLRAFNYSIKVYK